MASLCLTLITITHTAYFLTKDTNTFVLIQVTTWINTHYFSKAAEDGFCEQRKLHCCQW